MLCLHAVADEDGHPLENEEESGVRLCHFGVRSLRHVSKVNSTIVHETSLRYVQTAPDDLQWQIYRHEFDEVIATTKSSPVPDGMPHSLYRCAGGLGSLF